MSKRETLINNVKEFGMTFPSRQRFVLIKKDDSLHVVTTENKGRIKLENEKVSQNKSLMADGSPTAILDVKDISSAEEYADTLLYYMEKWGIVEDTEE